MAFIYQEYNNNEHNRMLVYDLIRAELATEIKINPIYVDNLYNNFYGLNIFQICRTSDIIDISSKNATNNTHYGQQERKKKVDYKVNYQIFVLFVEKLGRFQFSEYEITHFNKKRDYQHMKKEVVKWTHIGEK